MKVFLKILFGMFILFIVFLVVVTLYLTKDLQKNKNLTIKNIDLTKIKDGIYNGSSCRGRWNNEVMISIKNHEVVSIKLIKTALFEEPDKTKSLFNRVIEEQKINVDVITGATATSKCYLKSIENALTKE